jgi:hypothetical protein
VIDRRCRDLHAVTLAHHDVAPPGKFRGVPEHLPAAGDVAAMPLADGAWGACQVTAASKDQISVAVLAWRSAQPPTLAELAGTGPLLLHHHSWNGRAEHANVGEPVPPDFVWLGRLPVPEALTGRPNSYTSWWDVTHQIVWQHRWDNDIPDRVRHAYKAASTRGNVEVDFGAGPVSMPATVGRLDLSARRSDLPEFPELPAADPVRWSALDRLPRCTSLVWSGPDRGLVAAIAGRPIIGKLDWHDPPAVVDLRGTILTDLTLHGGRVRDLRLPRSLDALTLSGIGDQPTVTAADRGRWLSLTAIVDHPQVAIPDGLDGVRDLTIVGAGVISTAALRRLSDLWTLTLRWRRSPGELTDASALGHVGALRHLRLVDAYGIDADTLPDLPALSHLDIQGLRRSVVRPLRARYGRAGVRLIIDGVKSDTWLAANHDNPFRDWVDADERGGRAACRAYDDAVAALDRLPPGQDGPEAVQATRPILQTLADRLNAVEARYGIIDTLRREEAADAFDHLAQRAGVPDEVAAQWFDDWRDF